MKSILGVFFVIAGLVAMAGSAGDCDGKCMEYANSMEEMMIAIFIGLTLFVTGGIILWKENS
tara:strand:- start:1833 stop:2018 length:186 start_codon:yes stop_codon:yes gene_type:complete